MKNEKRRAYHAEYYKKNKETILLRKKERDKIDRQKWKDYKASLSCTECGAKHSAIIDFHHPDHKGEIKVSFYARRRRWKDAYAEAANCIALCANCHRILHYNDREKGGSEPPS